MSSRFALALLVSLAVVAPGCTRCGAPAPEPPKQPLATPFDAGDRLTEADTDRPVDRTVTDEHGEWTLKVPADDWRAVKPAPTRRLMPSAELWLVNPALDAHATVRCNDVPIGRADLTAFQASAEARVTAVGRTFTLLSSTPVDGPWLDGLELVYQTKAGATAWDNVHRVVAHLDQVCEVQAWTLAAGPDAGEGALPELKLLVSSFMLTPKPGVRAVTEVFRVLREPRVQGGIAALLDAGVAPEHVGLAIVGRGIIQLPDELVDERFRLRLALLARASPETCGALVRQTNDPELLLGALDTLTQEEAERWVVISKAAIYAQVEGTATVRAPTEKELARAKKALLEGHPDVGEALAALTPMDRQDNVVVCAAERIRLTRAFQLDLKTRVVLFRSWLGR